MRVAVTGASGFVGRHVVQALATRGHELVAVSRQPAPAPFGVTTLAMDMDDAGDDTFTRLGRPDVLVHLAWGGLPNYRAMRHVEHELPRQQRFLAACLGQGLPRLVVAGTCLEYGLHEGELAESMATHPVTAYASAKQQLHAWLETLRASHGFGLAWLRLFYLYGSGQAPTSLYSQLRNAAKTGASHFDMSPGDQVRDFLPVEVAAARIADLTLTHRDPGIVNICSGLPVTVHDIAQRWLRDWDANITLNRGVHSYPDYEPFSFWGNRQKLASLTGEP